VNERQAQAIERVRTDDKHGASWLAREAVEAVAEVLELGEDPVPLARELVRARPAMGAIPGALGRILAAGRTPEQMAEEARALMEGRERATRSIAVLLQPYIEGVVMTHSASATVREALVHTPPDRVVCTVSEPGGEGRELADELTAAELTVEVVDDSDAAHAVATVDLLLVGADTVFRDGALVNKVGTSDLARAAKEAGRPVIVACEVIKVAPVDAHDPGEWRFDLTSPEHIDRFVTEEGIFAPEEIPALVDRTPFLRDGYALFD
jgi:translation initiation factor 2B subunit (eIF-2B alpha/beta/delta family)